MMDPLKVTNKVFVYGTLKAGYGNNRLLEKAKFIGEAVTQKAFSLSDCGFPYMHNGDERHPVRGEIYEIDEEILRNLDILEGVDYGHYSRGTLQAQKLGDGEAVMAWAYVAPKSTGSRHPLCAVEEGMFVWQR